MSKWPRLDRRICMRTSNQNLEGTLGQVMFSTYLATLAWGALYLRGLLRGA